MANGDPNGRFSPQWRLRLLIVEDEPRDAELMLAALIRGGFEVESCVANSPDLVAHFLEKGQADIVLSDYDLGSWNAMDCLEIVKKTGKDIPLVVVTGTQGDEAAAECIKQGAANFVLKDRLVRLPTAVRRALEEKRLRDERKRAEEALIKLRKAVDASGEVIFMTDREGIFTFVNPEFTRLYGYTEEEVIGKTTPRVLKSGSQRPEDYASLWKTILDKRVEKQEWVNKTKDGRLVDIENSANPILDEQGDITGFLAIQRDITARKQLEEQFRQSQKMEAVGRLAGGIAHDFNNLLTIINGYSQLLLDRLGPSDLARGQVEEIKKAGDRAATLTRQLLAFSRRQVLQPKVLNLSSIVASIDTMLRRLIGEDIDLVTVLEPALGPVVADPGQIEQVILNLAVNSRDAMPQGGKLTLETANVELDEAYTRSHAGVAPGRYVMLAVSDTGIGMDAETQAQIFEPFFTTKEKGKGTGLGLATVYGIVKQSGGHIWLYSEPGRGATFKIYVPRVEEGIAAKAASPASVKSLRGAETILLVEDEEAVRRLAARILQEYGYKVLESTSAQEALQMGEGHKGSIDLLLTDVVMPVMGGREVAGHLAFFRPEMKVLYMSGYTDNAIVHHRVLEAGTAFLQKPFTPDGLARKVREVLDESRIPPARAA